VFRSDLVDHGRWSDDRFKPHGFWRVLFYPAVWAFHRSNAAIELNARPPGADGAGGGGRAGGSAWREHGGAAVGCVRAVGLYAVGVSVLILRYLTVQEALSGVLVLAAVAAWVLRRVALPAGIALVVITGIAAVTTRYPWWARASRADQAIVMHVRSIPPDALLRAVAAPGCHGCRNQQQSAASGRERNITAKD
jgi:hypothetical protein